MPHPGALSTIERAPCFDFHRGSAVHYFVSVSHTFSLACHCTAVAQRWPSLRSSGGHGASAVNGSTCTQLRPCLLPLALRKAARGSVCPLGHERFLDRFKYPVAYDPRYSGILVLTGGVAWPLHAIISGCTCCPGASRGPCSDTPPGCLHALCLAASGMSVLGSGDLSIALSCRFRACSAVCWLVHPPPSLGL